MHKITLVAAGLACAAICASPASAQKQPPAAQAEKPKESMSAQIARRNACKAESEAKNLAYIERRTYYLECLKRK